MEVNQPPYLLDLPNEILQKIMDYLPFLALRKNLRLTCRRLRDLCNLEHFCRDEVIMLPIDDDSWRQLIADFSNSSRGCYNLSSLSIRLKSNQVSEFFQQHGAKVRSLHLNTVEASPGLFELITFYCEGLVSLNIRSDIFPTYASQENFVPRPSVTSLVLKMKVDLLGQMLPGFCYQMPTIFPCVKHLKITWQIDVNAKVLKEKERYVHGILNFASNFRHLQSLNVKISIEELAAEVPQFPKLKDLRLHLNGSNIRLHRVEKISDIIRTSFSVFISQFIGVNISSIKMTEMDELYLSDIMPLLNGIGLEHLHLRPCHSVHLNRDNFVALVSSHLKMICFYSDPTAPWAEEMIENWAIQANKTVTDLKVDFSCGYGPTDDKWPLMTLFCTYFHGLVHLETDIVDNDILQRIFKYQKNLRSLKLHDCGKCTINGFCGGEDGLFENTITDLQKLELLEIGVDPKVIWSECFQTAFRFPRLRYLHMSLTPCMRPLTELSKLESLIDMFKSCIHLTAISLNWYENPSSKWILSLFQNLKYLNYVNIHDAESFRFTYVNLNHFYWIDWEKLKSKCPHGSFYYDQDSDRTVFTLKSGYDVQIHSPKISSYTVEWISVCIFW